MTVITQQGRKERQGYRARRVPLLLGLVLLAVPVVAGPQPPAFRDASPGYHYAFPKDHGAHEQFQTEWWYYTGHLRTERGQEFGYELTFFRRGIDHPDAWQNRSRWAIRQLYFAHLALTDLDAGRFRYAEKISRAGLGQAGAAADRLRVWIDRWSVEASDDGQHQLIAETSDFSLELMLTPLKAPVVHGADGVSRKGDEPHHTSHYYSISRLATQGTLRLGDRLLAVRGASWMDHEFGSGTLAPSLVGWDWFSMQLHDGRELMLYLLRHEDGRIHAASSGTIVSSAGDTIHLSSSDFMVAVLDWWVSPHSGARYPSGWRIAIPSHQLELTVTPRLKDQELRTARSTQVTYWEGAVSVRGAERGEALRGEGYVELTGYARDLTSRGSHGSSMSGERRVVLAPLVSIAPFPSRARDRS